MSSPITMDVHRIQEWLPHRYPFLLVDRVEECQPGEFIRALKNVSVNEPFFPGHFPQRAVMPGVLILEAMAQASGLLAFETQDNPPDDNMLFYFVGIDKARFKRVVEPGDQLMLHSTIIRNSRGMWKFDCKAEVDGQVAAAAEVMCAAREIE
ncbi:3-hydroxyacyl-[acyl-carrier-protein] dehydratase [Natronospira proteinivora]|uniref:3-hydroxyacyl-[acyl-carrier-protein] dehydratase FabZ n=2 Tax=Natronospira proteinivora TaxID=1807133 RepID=A0ABT1G5Q8_9GAMM|nr:3-hydroxyacyl-[acyl-carrier-protein] dehydratase [Natronospira proteinivora]